MLSRRYVETSLVALFLLECLVILAIAGQNEFSPLSSSAQILLLASVTLVSVAIRLIKSAGCSFASRFTPQREKIRKFGDQSWHLVLHCAFTAAGLYIVTLEDGGTRWLDDAASLWQADGGVHVRSADALFRLPSRASLHALYLAQTSVYVATTVSHVFVEERHNDFLLMLSHHLVTLALIGLSYWFNTLRLGVVVMLLHDASDIVIDVLKLCNYLGLEGRRHLFAVEATFATNFVTWAYARLYLLPVHVVWRGVIVAPREVVTAPGSPGRAALVAYAGGDARALGHAPGYRVPRDVGHGKFDALASIMAVPMHDVLLGPYYVAFVALLGALILMNLAWYAMFWRMLYRLAQGDTPGESGDAVYEGDGARAIGERKRR